MPLISSSRATGNLFGPKGHYVSFGFITDCHWDSIKVTDTGKYYTDTVKKVDDIVAVFNNTPNLSFVMQNGDWIDGCASAAAAKADLATVTASFNAAKAPKKHNIGNHDVWMLTKAEIMAITGQPSKYYSFAYDGVTFIVLDGSYTADSDDADLEVSFDDSPSPYVSYIPPTQRQWLADTIAASAYPCVIICHYPVYYVGASSWGLTNAAAVRTILEAAGTKVIGCVSGHLHDNFIVRVNGILYATVHATVTDPYPSLSYSIVSVYPDTKELKLVSKGYEMSYIK